MILLKTQPIPWGLKKINIPSFFYPSGLKKVKKTEYSLTLVIVYIAKITSLFLNKVRIANATVNTLN